MKKKEMKNNSNDLFDNEKEMKREKIQENKLLKKMLAVIGVFFLILIISFFAMKYANNPKYDGLTFNVVQQGELTLYQTTIPIIHKGKVAYYNIYLRNNPKEIDRKVPFKGEITSIDDAVIDITQEFDCNGDQVIAIANLVNLYGAVGKKIIRDENASCDELGRYTYLVVQEGEKTSVEQFGPKCYNINIDNCEILEGTERYIGEMLVKINSDIYG